ncbi:unnamed protein product [Closterium sp. Naga37s-1]|nr:unnamed protein product [Closterium sp. Naga37s-1]
MTSITRAALSAALLACFVVLLAPPEKYVAAQSSFLVEKAKTLRAVANQTAANLTAAQADAARRADEVAAATQALSDLLAPDTALNDRVSSISDMNIMAFAEAQETRKYVEDVYGDIVVQDLRAQARLARVQQELTDLQLNPPTVDVNVFPKAVEDAKVAVSVARQVYDGMLAAITDGQKAVIMYKATKAKAVTDAKTRLAKAKQSQAVADKKVIQLTDKLKAVLVQADNAEKAAGISNTAGVSNTAGISKTAALKKKGAIQASG